MSRVKSTVEFYRNVPLKNDFQDSVLFDSKKDQTNYFSKFKVDKLTIKDLSYQRTEFQIRIPSEKEEFKYENMQDINYLKVTNPSYEGAPIDQVTYYGFVTNTNYINDGTCFVDWVVDPVQSFMFRWELSDSFIERSTYSVLTGKGNNIHLDEQKRYLLNENESIGSDNVAFPITQKEVTYEMLQSDVSYLVIVVSDSKNVSNLGVPQQLTFYVIPFNSKLQMLLQWDLFVPVSGETLHNEINANMTSVLTDITQNAELFGGGTNIVNAYYTKHVGIDFKMASGTDSDKKIIGSFPEKLPTGQWQVKTVGIGKIKYKIMQINSMNVADFTEYNGNFFDPDKTETDEKGNESYYPIVGSKYYVLRTAFNKYMTQSFPDILKRINALQGEYGLEKLFTNPFAKIVLGDTSGTEIEYTLQGFSERETGFKAVMSGFPSKSNKVQFALDGYNNTFIQDNLNTLAYNRQSQFDSKGQNIELVLDSFKLQTYLTKNRIQQGYDNASLSMRNNAIQQTAATQNFKQNQQYQVAANDQSNRYATASQIRQADFSTTMLNTQQGQEWGMFGYNQVSGALQNTFSGLMSGGLLGAAGGLGSSLVGAANGAVTMEMNNQNASTNLGMTNNFAAQNVQAANENATQQLALSQGNASAQYYNSLSASQTVMKNNYKNALDNINAGLADMRLQPGNSVVSSSDSGFDYAHEYNGYFIQLYTQQPEAMLRIAEYFAQFGYSYNRIGNVNEAMRARSKFNYIKTNNMRVYGNFSNKWRDTIGLIFDSGIRFWRDTEAMKKYDITNNL